MVFNISEQIAYLSTVMTLEPGDILATGTASGVGATMSRHRGCKSAMSCGWRSMALAPSRTR